MICGVYILKHVVLFVYILCLVNGQKLTRASQIGEISITHFFNVLLFLNLNMKKITINRLTGELLTASVLQKTEFG